jgi:hypothetical protein
MDHTQLSTVLFMCNVRDRCSNIRNSGHPSGHDVMREFHDFTIEVEKHKARKIKDSTLIKKGSSFLMRFPDLRLRFWKIMGDPRGNIGLSPKPAAGNVRNKSKPMTVGMSNPTAATGIFAWLPSDVFSDTILCALPYPVAARMANSCKRLHNIITIPILVDLRQRFETLTLSTPVVGGGVPLQMVAIDGQPLALHIVCKRLGVMGLEHRGRRYVLESPPFNTQDEFWHRRITWRTSATAQLTLFGLLNAIASAPPGEPLDLCMWVKLEAFDEASVSIEVSAYGEFNRLTRTHDGVGVKHWFTAKGFRSSWGPVQ